MNRLQTCLWLAFVLLLSIYPNASHAQVTGTVRVGDLEEVVVTARKREESLQDVPIAISVVSGDAVRESSITKLEDLAPTLPNFHHGEAVSGNDQIAVRGIASGVNFGFENSVGQVFDGVFFGRSRYGRSLFMDLERIEVLKGPQGALIGKNTTAGAINITSAKPTETFEAYIAPTWEFEGDEGFVVEGAVSGPLADRFRGRIAARYEDRDGYLDNLFRNTTEMQREETSVRAQLAADLTEDLQVNLLYQYGDQVREGRPTEAGSCEPFFQAALQPLGDDCTWNLTNSRILLVNGVEEKSRTDTETQLGILTIDWETTLGIVTSVTAYSKYDTEDFWDADGISVEAVALKAQEDYKQWSQELRLTSTGDNVIDYVIGLYYLDVDQSTRFSLNFNFMGPPPLPELPPPLRATNNRFTDQESETIAGFGEATWNINEQWKFIAGLRYTHEEKDARHQEFATEIYTDNPRPAPPGGPAAGEHDVTDDRTENQWTPSGTLQWYPNDRTMLYGKISTGFKGGGFDHQLSGDQATAEARFEFEDEQVIAYEAGGKLQFPDARVRLNLAVFRSEFDDLQVSTIVPGVGTVFRVGNAASANTQGVEADLQWNPIGTLTLTAAGAYLDAEFDDYVDAPCYAGQTEEQGCIDGNQDLSGKQLQYSPEWSFNFEGRYTWPVTSAIELTLFGRAYFNEEHPLALDLDPKTFSDDYWKFDASIGLADPDGRWRVALIGRNLTDELTSNFSNDGPGPDGASAQYFSHPPRSYSLQAQVNFGGT
jgi:outer membrane receptor protein involved in Fe transport